MDKSFHFMLQYAPRKRRYEKRKERQKERVLFGIVGNETGGCNGDSENIEQMCI
jgi:hypothetical protein